jgi:hypothetical protein
MHNIPATNQRRALWILPPYTTNQSNATNQDKRQNNKANASQ